MLQIQLIGNIGANAEVKVSDGREFVTFRVAHKESYVDGTGNRVVKTMWVDCTMSCADGRPAVLPYLTTGTQVYVVGSVSTRVYSSEKDRCMKAGITIHVQRVELLGGAADVVPKRLYTTDGEMIPVTKYYNVQAPAGQLIDSRGRRYLVDKKGWVTLPQEPTNNNGND